MFIKEQPSLPPPNRMHVRYWNRLPSAKSRLTFFWTFQPLKTSKAEELQENRGGTMKTLLVLDGEALVMNLLVHVLRHYSVLQATTAEQALRLFSDHACQIDLLVADVAKKFGVKGGAAASRRNSGLAGDSDNRVSLEPRGLPGSGKARLQFRGVPPKALSDPGTVEHSSSVAWRPTVQHGQF